MLAGVQEARVAAEMARAELAGARACVEVDTTNEENRGLKAQVEEYAALVGAGDGRARLGFKQPVKFCGLEPGWWGC